MLTKQERYAVTKKGKVARRRAVANYQTKFVDWKARLEPEMSDALDRAKPEGVSRSAFAKEIFQKYLDQEFLDGTSSRIYPWNQSKI